MFCYQIPVLVQIRRYPRVATSATPIRTTSAMPMMDPKGRPLVLLSSEIRRKREEKESKVKTGETRRDSVGRTCLGRKARPPKSGCCVS